MKKHTQNRRCLLCVTDGSEEIETVTIFDTIKRAPGLDLTVAKVFRPSGEKGGAASLSSASDLKNELSVTLMHGLKIVTINSS